MFLNFYRNKKVLVTGCTGFKGSWLCLWLKHLGAQVFGYSLPANGDPSLFVVLGLENLISVKYADVRSLEEFGNFLTEVNPDIVFHLAAQAVVRKSYTDPLETWSTNVMGVFNVLEACRRLTKKCSVVIVTSDKCYENKEWHWGYREHDSLGGSDPYSASKASAEFVFNSMRKSFYQSTSGVRMASARAGNVVGGGDWTMDRIVPDCVRSWTLGEEVSIRNPSATRPWQHVLEPLSGYLVLAKGLWDMTELHGESFNFGPESKSLASVEELVRLLGSELPLLREGKTPIKIELPVDGDIEPHEHGLLRLNCDKAQAMLGWLPVWNIKSTVAQTASWYASFYRDSSSVSDLSVSQIIEYQEMASSLGYKWAN